MRDWNPSTRTLIVGAHGVCVCVCVVVFVCAHDQ